MGGSSKSVTIGYRYYLGMQMVICHGPIDAITRIDVSERTVWTGSANSSLTISASEIFGGDSREGGISGQVDVLLGASNQPKNDYLVSVLGEDIPAFRGVVSAVLRQVYVGLNPYLKPWAFWARRVNVKTDGSQQWYSSKAAIGQYDLNPAHIILECLTDLSWGLGYSPSIINYQSFTAAADKLYTENFGLSILWSKSSSIEEFIGDVLAHIDGQLYVDRSTGLFTLKLIRNDYDAESLQSFDESNVRKISQFKRTNPSELVNTVNVKYFDVETGKEASVTVQDASLIIKNGVSNSVSNSYFGISNADLAVKVASRDLKALSLPLATCTIYANRDAAKLNLGDAIKLSWSDYGFEDLIMRVSSVELGDLSDNAISVSLIEDVFTYADGIYASPTTTAWVKPQSQPLPSQFHRVDEVTYYELATTLNTSELEAVEPTSSFLFLSAVRPSNDSINMQLMSFINSQWVDRGRVDFCPSAVTIAEVSKTQQTISIASGVDLDLVRIGSYAYLGNEIVRVDSLSTSSITVGRGCLDTVPALHQAGTRIFFIDVFGGSDEYEYVQGENASVKLRPVTPLGVLPVASAPTQSLQIQCRHYKPYAPGNFRINGVQYNQIPVGPINIQWSHRDRLLQTGGIIVSTTDGDIGPEVGVSYTLTIQRQATPWTNLINVSGISVTSYSWSTESSDVLDGFSSVQRFLLKSVRDSVDSHQQHEHIVSRVGVGYNLGNNLGGV